MDLGLWPKQGRPDYGRQQGNRFRLRARVCGRRRESRDRFARSRQSRPRPRAACHTRATTCISRAPTFMKRTARRYRRGSDQRARPHRHPDQQRGRGQALRSRLARRRRFQGGDGRQIFPLHLPAAGRAASRWPSARERIPTARAGHDRQHHRHGRQDRERHPYRGRRGERGADARDRRPRASLREARHPHQRDQSGRDAHRTRRGSTRAGGAATRRHARRSAGSAGRRRCRSGAMQNRRKSPTSRSFWRAAGRAMYRARSSRWMGCRRRSSEQRRRCYAEAGPSQEVVAEPPAGGRESRPTPESSESTPRRCCPRRPSAPR